MQTILVPFDLNLLNSTIGVRFPHGFEEFLDFVGIYEVSPILKLLQDILEILTCI